jgi:malate dehydrogenase (oxaloacetate-decarboxylating)
MQKDYAQLSIESHKKHRGKIEVVSKLPVTNRDELSIAYTPGVAAPCLEIAKDKNLAKEMTSTKNMVAVISDGSAVLGLGNIGAEAALPVMEGKCVLFKTFAGIDAFPIVLGTQDTEEIIATIKSIAPTFGAINLEDISAPRCFEIEKRLIEELDIPLMHDDQHGTAVVVLAGIINALKVVNKNKEDVRVVFSGAGAAGIASAKLLYSYGIKNIILVDSKGIVSNSRTDLDKTKKEMLQITNKDDTNGSLQDAIKGADIFIGVSKPKLLSKEDIQSMNKDAIIFALANPTPEIMPDIALSGGAKIIATGRSDFPNQVNNSLAFPGIFKGTLQSGAKKITEKMKIAAAEALSSLVKQPTAEKIIPDPFDNGICEAVTEAVAKAS